jgi:predicted TIM-barrel fold metal-dependent hydrolase
MDLGFEPIDADNHYYESLDTFTRHLDPKFAQRGVQVVSQGKLGSSGYELFSAMRGGVARFEGYGKTSILSKILVSDRAIHDTIASMVVDGVFWRHPTLRVASVENGSDWMQLLVRRLQKQANQTPWAFEAEPLETIRRNVWVTPYYEEDLRALADLIGVERVLFGCDWPHGEGLAEPTDVVKELDAFEPAEVRRIMRDNTLDLLGLETV